MEFNNKVVIVTGGVQGIGKTIAEEFQKQGALICSIDKQPGVYFTGDLAAFYKVIHTVQRLQKCRFSTSTWSDKSGNLFFWNMHIDVM